MTPFATLDEALSLANQSVYGLSSAIFTKDVGAARWIAAVNHWGRLGHWRYAKIHSPRQLGVVLGDSRRDP